VQPTTLRNSIFQKLRIVSTRLGKALIDRERLMSFKTKWTLWNYRLQHWNSN